MRRHYPVRDPDPSGGDHGGLPGAHLQSDSGRHIRVAGSDAEAEGDAKAGTDTILVPPKPTGVKFDEQRRVGTDASSTKITQTIRWAAPRNAEVEIKVYGVTECSRCPKTPPQTRPGRVWSLAPRYRRRFARYSPPRPRRRALSVGRGPGSSNAANLIRRTTPRGLSTTPSCWLPTTRQATRSLPSQRPAGGRSPVLTRSSADLATFRVSLMNPRSARTSWPHRQDRCRKEASISALWVAYSSSMRPASRRPARAESHPRARGPWALRLAVPAIHSTCTRSLRRRRRSSTGSGGLGLTKTGE